MTAARAVRRLPAPSGAPPIDRSVPLHERRRVVQNPDHRDSMLAATDLEVSTEERGIINGLANTFSDEYDCYNSRFRSGCFKRSIKEKHAARIDAGRASKIKILMQHNRWDPIGIALELEEIAEGLRSKGKISCPDEGPGYRALALADDGVLDGISVGFNEVEGGVEYLPIEEYEENGFDPDDWWTFWFPPRDYTDLDLKEYSLVTFPAHDDARVESVVRSFAPQWGGWRADQNPTAPPKGESRTAYAHAARDRDLSEIRKVGDQLGALLARFEDRHPAPAPDPGVRNVRVSIGSEQLTPTTALEDDDESILAALRDLVRA